MCSWNVLNVKKQNCLLRKELKPLIFPPLPCNGVLKAQDDVVDELKEAHNTEAHAETHQS